ncbi:MAG: hypothetical protein HQL56_05665 [Magnetococcales bacterium]|nr:hypothetical protein [Magnetococcales bacterium]
MTQAEFGSIGGVCLHTQMHYEKGRRHPNSAYLSALAAAGVDTHYILTGVRMNPLPPPTPGAGSAPSNGSGAEVAQEA